MPSIIIDKITKELRIGLARVLDLVGAGLLVNYYQVQCTVPGNVIQN